MSLPTNQEQEMLERINRLRMDPHGEFGRLIVNAATKTGVTADITNALQFFKVDLTLFEQQMNAFSAVAPLAWHTKLEDAAAGHSAAMIAADSQSHQVPGEASLGTRITNAGYTNWSVLGENIFAFTSSVIQGHAAFVIDWGVGVGGMQTPAGHRNNLMNANFTEIGIDITAEANPATSVGPLVVTQDLGSRFGYASQILGVVFDDGDADAFYDAGEGLGGVTVAVSGTGGSFNTTTWGSGGYQIAVPQGTYTITFSGGSLTKSYSVGATLGTANIKVDLNTDLGGPPATPTVPDLAPASDSGTSNTDNMTNVTAPVFTGTAEAGATVTLLEGAVTIGTGTAAGDGTWSIKANTLSAGAHVIKARASNVSGDSGVSAGLTVTIDTTAPATAGVPDMATGSDQGISSTDNITRQVTPTFTGTAEAGATVTLRDGATIIGTGTANIAGAWIIKASTMADGPHQITAQATDKAGNTGPQSAPLAVTIDTTPPVAPTLPNLVNSSDTGRSVADNITSITTPRFAGQAEAGGTVTLSSAGVTLGSATVSAAGNWSVMTGVLGEGTHNIVARATDIAGNTSAFSAALAVVIDTTPPAAPVITTASTTRITGTSEAGAQVTIRDGVTVLGSAIAGTTGAWSFTTALAAGTHALTAGATDRAGNAGAFSAAITARIGTAGNDTLTSLAGVELMDGAAGDDTYHVNDTTDVVTEAASAGSDTIFASVDYTLPTASAVEFLRAATGAPGLTLTGNELANTLTGGDGGDTLVGGVGGDVLFGGKAADIFAYLALAHSTVALTRQDLILDFSQAEGDRINLTALDANAGTAGDQAFTFIGAAAFSGAAGQLRSVVVGADTLVSGDVTGDSKADFAIRLLGSHTLGGADFML